MTKQSTTPNTSATTFPKGRFTYTVGDATPTVDFDELGIATVTYEGVVIVVAAYQVNGDVFEIVDQSGPYANPELGVGRYKWSLSDRTVLFSLIEDQNVSRRKGFLQPFVMQA